MPRNESAEDQHSDAPRDPLAGVPRSPALRVHLATDDPEYIPYRLDRTRFEAAGREFPDVFGRLAPTYSDDFRGFREGMRDAEVLIGWKFPREALIEAAPRLRWIQLVGAGVDHLAPFDWLPPGVRLLTASGVHTGKSFEYFLLGILAIHTRLRRLMRRQRRRRWSKIQTGTVPGKTALVIGLGAVGTGAARAAKTLGMRVLGYRRSARPHEHCDELVAPEDLHRALPCADYLLLAAPLTRETLGLIGERELALLPEGAGLVNLGRGRLVSQPALVAALESGRLAGAFLDVVWPEPHPPESPLWEAPNLILTPHVGADDIEQYIPLCYRIALRNFDRYFRGLPLRNEVDLELGY